MVVRFRGLTFDAARRQVTDGGGKELHLTPKAFDLLAVLIEEAPRVVTKSELHARLWPETFVSEATLVGLVKELRRTLSDRSAQSPIIRTAHRVGYAFCAPIEKQGPEPSASQHWVVVGNKMMALKDGENPIGRDPACSICLDAAGVSRCHAQIRVGSEGAQLDDLASKNGTVCRGETLTAPVSLKDGDHIRIGPVLLVYRWSVTGMSTATFTST